MKRTKKLIAFLLAIVTAITAVSVSSFAWDEEIDYSKCIGLYTDVNNDYYLAMNYYFGFNFGTQFSFYRVEENGARTLIKEMTESETTSFDYGTPMRVDKDLFTTGGKYVLKVNSVDVATETDVSYNVSKEYEFTYEDLKNKPICATEMEFCITEGESIDLEQYVLIPVGYNGGVTYELWNDSGYFGDSYVIHFEDFAKIEGSVVTGLSNGAVYVDLYNDNEECNNSIYIEILDKEPETVFELMEDSIKKLSEGWFNASVETGTYLLGIVSLFLWPIILPFEILLSVIPW